MRQIVISAVGPDRPGLVDQFSGELLERGANIADSRMVNLRGQFALIVLIEISDEQAEALLSQIAAAGEKIGLTVSATPLAGAAASAEGLPYQLKVYAMDQPGIVHRVTHLLHGFGANVEDLQTHLEPAAHSGTPLFTMQMKMTVPPSVHVKKLRRELEDLCDSLNCDIDLQPGQVD